MQKKCLNDTLCGENRWKFLNGTPHPKHLHHTQLTSINREIVWVKCDWNGKLCDSFTCEIYVIEMAVGIYCKIDSETWWKRLEKTINVCAIHIQFLQF